MTHLSGFLSKRFSPFVFNYFALSIWPLLPQFLIFKPSIWQLSYFSKFTILVCLLTNHLLSTTTCSQQPPAFDFWPLNLFFYLTFIIVLLHLIIVFHSLSYFTLAGCPSCSSCCLSWLLPLIPQMSVWLLPQILCHFSDHDNWTQAQLLPGDGTLITQDGSVASSDHSAKVDANLNIFV